MKLLALGISLVVLALPPMKTPSPESAAAQEFLSSLSSEQRSHATYALNSPERYHWAYVPGPRKGISWGEMNPAQKLAAQHLLRTTLSSQGFERVETIRNLESVLAEMENGNMERDPNRYWFVFFGTPSDQSAWAWRYEGHHVSLTFGNRDGAVISSTPQFLGSNPAEVRSGPRKGQRVLAAEQDLGFRLVEALSPTQTAKAVLAQAAPADIVTAASRNASIEGHLGLPYGDLTAAQQKLLIDLIRTHASVQSKSEQKRRLDSVKADGYESLVFAWLGPIKRDGRHYYRIQGKSFLIEYDNTQEDGNHIHTVWRDMKGDYGEDVLSEHYVEDHHHHHDD